MIREIQHLRQAWRMFRSDRSVETVAALVIAAVVVGPIVFRLWQDRRRETRYAGRRR